MLDSLLTRLRQCLMLEPSPAVWNELQQLLLEPLNEEERAFVQEYLEEHLSSWPSELRELFVKLAHMRELPPLLEHPAFPLARSLKLRSRPAEAHENSESLGAAKVQLQRFFSSPELKHLKHLSFQRWQSQSWGEEVAECTAPLQSFKLETPPSFYSYRPDALVQMPCLETLEHLTLGTLRWVDEELVKLLSSRRWKHLRELYLSVLEEESLDVLQTITRNPALSTLRKLYYASSGIYTDGLSEWLQNSALEELELLSLGFQEISAVDHFVEHLCDAGALKNLHTLQLQNVLFQPERMLRLMSTDGLPALRHLHLFMPDLSQEDGEEWWWSIHEWQSLETLELSFPEARFQNSQERTTSLMTQLGQAKLPVRHLILDGNQWVTQDFEALFDAEVWPALEYLSLRHCNLGNNEATLLANTSTLPSLKALDLAHNPVLNTGTQALLKHRSELTALRLETHHLKEKTLKELREVFEEKRSHSVLEGLFRKHRPGISLTQLLTFSS